MPVQNSNQARVRSTDEVNYNTSAYEIASGPVANHMLLMGYTSPVGRQTAMTDVVTSNFAQRKANGEVIFNPMSRTEITLSDNSSGPAITQVTPAWAVGQMYSMTGNYLSYVLGGISATPMNKIPASLLPTFSDHDWVKRAVSEACTQALRPPQTAGVLVTLAEMEKTKRLVPGLLQNWRKFFAVFSKPSKGGKTSNRTAIKNAAKHLGRNLSAAETALVDTWLAMRFGVRPLVMDTLNVIDAIKASQKAALERITQRGHSSGATSESSSYELASGVTRTQVLDSVQVSVDVRAMNMWEVKMDLIRDVGISIASVPEAAIDLVTFSFVVNWVMNVNDFFASMGASLDPALHSLGGCYVVRTEMFRTVQALSSVCTDPTYVISRQPFGLLSISSVVKQRTVGLVSPKLVVRADPLKFTRDLRLLDAIALTRVVLRGRNVRNLANLSKTTRAF